MMYLNKNTSRNLSPDIQPGLNKNIFFHQRRALLLDADCSKGGSDSSENSINHRLTTAIITVILVFVFLGCAKVASPPGGPKDKAGPEITMSSPENLSIGVPRDSKLTFIIDEWYDYQSFEDAFFISPAPPGEIKFKFGLRKAVVSFEQPLADARTYIVTLGAGFRDLNRNNMAASFDLAFSTGYKFDHGYLSGRVIAAKPGGLLAALYLLDQDFLPQENTGEYLTQTGDDGSFKFNYLPPGDYRLLVFRDSDNNRLFDPGFEDAAIPQQDFQVAGDTTLAILIKLNQTFAEPPKIKSIDPKNAARLEVTLNRPLEFLPQISGITISDTALQSAIAVDSLHRHPADSARLVIFTAQLDSVEYVLYIKGGVDHQGMQADDSLTFRGNPAADTLAPAILKYSAEGDSTSAEILLITSESVETQSLSAAFTMPAAEDTLIIQLPVSAVVYRSGYCQYKIFPDSIAAGDILNLNLNLLIDLAGNSGPDTLVQIDVLRTEAPPDVSDPGSLSGTASFAGEGPAVIQLIQKKSEIARTVLSEPGAFRFENIPSGYYSFKVFIDADANGRYDFGLWKPFRHSEKFVIIPDTFRVRERWETGGVEIDFGF